MKVLNLERHNPENAECYVHAKLAREICLLLSECIAHGFLVHAILQGYKTIVWYMIMTPRKSGNIFHTF